MPDSKRILRAPPQRGFSEREFAQRTEAAQRRMHEQRLDALLLTTEAEIRYFTGFLTQFWLSPTRPWYLIVPSEGKPVAVIPSIGEVGMRNTWIEEIRCWPSPRPDDDGISLLAGSLAELPRRHGRVGVPMGPESHLRMPAADFSRLGESLPGIEFVDCARMLQSLCSIKSAAEADKIRHACQLASDSFAALPGFARLGDSERTIVRNMRIDLLQRGADQVPFMVSASGPGGYDNIIMGPVDRCLDKGDVLIIDTGAQFDGYYCDFDRNYAFERVDDATRRAYEAVYRSTEAGFAAAVPGATTADIWRAMWKPLEAAGTRGNAVGRMGHGLGMQLTEWPSITPDDSTEIKPGMVLTLEPGMSYGDNRQMVHEENILITETGAEILTQRAPPEIMLVG